MAELNIRERQAGDVTILDLEGKITIGEGSVRRKSSSTCRASATLIRAASANSSQATRPSGARAAS